MTGEPACVDAQPSRAWHFPAWTWIILHFAFVASLAVVWHLREPWVRRGRLPGHLYMVNYEHGTALISLDDADDESRRALLDIASLTITHPVVDAKSPYGKPVFLPAERRVAFKEFRPQEGTATCRVVDLDSGTAYILLDGRALHMPALDPSGRRLLTFEDRRALILDAGTGETMATLPMPSLGHGSWLSDGSAVLIYADDTETVYLWDTTSATPAWTFHAQAEPRPAMVGAEENAFVVVAPRPAMVIAEGNAVAVIFDMDRGPGMLLDLRSGKVLRQVAFDEDYGDMYDWGRFRWAMFGLDSRRIIAVDRDGYVWITETMTGRTIGGIQRAEDASYVAVSADGKRLATRAVGEIVIIDLDTGEVLTRVELEDGPLRAGVLGHSLFSDEFLVWGRDVFHRRFPKWWWGHLYRPEVWAAMLLGAAWLWSVARWARGEWRERRAAG